MSRAVVVGAGSCLLEAIVAGLHRLPRADEEAELHLSQLGADGRAGVPQDVLARCTVLIEEACPLRRQFMLSEAERARLPAGCATILVPTLHMNSLWPLMTEDPRNVPEAGAPYGRIPRPFADKLALQVREQVRDPAKRMAAYLATDVLAAQGLPRRTNSGCRTVLPASTAATSALPPTCCTISASCGCSTRTATPPGG